MSNREYLLFSPWGVAAIAALAVNDAWLKSLAGTGPWAPLTGKLSGIAGIIVLPALLEVILSPALPRRGAALISVGVTAAVFVLLEVSQTFVNVYTTTNQAIFDVLHLPWRSTATMDMTDLAVLPVLVFSYWGMRRYAARLCESQITV